MKNKVNNIILHYPFVPNYRVPVFNELSKSDRVNLLLLSALRSNDKTLLSEKKDWNFNHKITKLISFKVLSRVIDIELGVLTTLLKERNHFKYYIILSNPNILSSWLYSLIAKLLGYKLVFWGHGLIKPDSGLKKLIRTVYYNIADIHWLYGNNAKVLMKDIGIDERKISVIYNSLDYNSQKEVRNKYQEQRLELRKRFGYSSDEFVLVCIGRLLDKLSIDLAIKAISEAKNRNLILKLIIIGSGPEEENLKKLTHNLNLNDSVIFTGAIYDEEVIGKYYLAANASCVMGRVGLSAMHSLAYGVPLITHSNIYEHCPEIEAIFPGSTGELFEKDSIDSFLSAVIRVKNSNVDYYNECIKVIEDYYTPCKQVQFMLESLDDD